MILEKLPKKI